MAPAAARASWFPSPLIKLSKVYLVLRFDSKLCFGFGFSTAIDK
jgi:hypothetical protein